MFNNEEDLQAYEDDIYREETSSDEDIDSEVEFYLYSQVHYSQNLNESNLEEDDTKKCVLGTKQQVNTDRAKNEMQPDFIALSDSEAVVSDTSAVIILSDTIEEDSIYFSKVKKKLPGKSSTGQEIQYDPHTHSTPKSSIPHKKNLKSCHTGSIKSYGGGYIQEVVVIRGSSEEGEVTNKEDFSTSESEMSDFENWMLLGRTREDGDASIQLNLRGYRISNNDEEVGDEWSIGEKDLEAQIGNYPTFRRSNRYYTDKNVVCRNCEKRGHLSKNCPIPKKLPACCLCGERGHLQNSCPARYCLNCFLPGHFFKECIERAYWKKTCHRCSMPGHFADACPEIWRQYHITSKPGPIKKPKSGCSLKDVVYCCNCAAKGHCAYECPDCRMSKECFTACQLVFSYDRDQDIWKRKQRAKNKIKELEEAGLLHFERSEYKEILEDYTPPFKKRKTTHLKREHSFQKKMNPVTSGKHMDLNCNKKHKSKKKRFGLNQHEEEDFPRGSHKMSSKSKHNDSTELTDEKANGSKRKRRRKQKRKRGESLNVDESLFIIKQKKKKSKRNVD
ncbi:hypothetical protein GDO86_001250 [Hymenochirus boettgeri]|uniref:Zinc finger CCHC domain-containing protein 7 n=1 Tax=Hymenochirus boettgeri TaxID=247094 RepID=A0A8T2KE10_9PIPI|nr:hypothetical protein GDO86_001250 [Hymenochirus boettgeri]KAG8454958.1 hypothetical protein GDO86_001250 [Hymenochirus boettgeri]